MKRDLVQLAQQQYDLLVIGGGVYGACVAWDAVQRGLSVALLEKGDFGRAASANNLKIIHGGLRYLQDGNLLAVRRMSQERQTWLRMAPHLVQPLACLLPTNKKFSRSKLALHTALIVNNLISTDRNRAMRAQHYLPNGRILSKEACLQLLPGLPGEGVDGVALWYDAQMLNSERLVLSIVQSAAAVGARVANYLEVTDFLWHKGRIIGVEASDILTGTTLALQSKLIINCAGAWVDTLLKRFKGPTPEIQFPLSTAVNIITRQIIPDYAVGLAGRGGEVRFVVPWRQYSLIGTLHQSYTGATPESEAIDAGVHTLIEDINFAYPQAELTLADVQHVHQGFLPAIPTSKGTAVKLLRHGRLRDHEVKDNVPGLITVVGVKFTTARSVAEQAVDMALRKLGLPPVASATAVTPVHGGDFSSTADLLEQAKGHQLDWLSAASLAHLIESYGANYEHILSYRRENPLWLTPVAPHSPILQAEIIHAVRCEMAQTLRDVIRRRTPLGAVGLPDAYSLHVCADLMTAELGWSFRRRQQEIFAAWAVYNQIKPEPANDTSWQNFYQKSAQPALFWPAAQSLTSN